MAPKPWDDPPHPKQGDKRASTTYEAVGRAFTQWEYLEAKLAELFSQLVGWARKDQTALAMRSHTNSWCCITPA